MIHSSLDGVSLYPPSKKKVQSSADRRNMSKRNVSVHFSLKRYFRFCRKSMVVHHQRSLRRPLQGGQSNTPLTPESRITGQSVSGEPAASSFGSYQTASPRLWGVKEKKTSTLISALSAPRIPRLSPGLCLHFCKSFITELAAVAESSDYTPAFLSSCFRAVLFPSTAAAAPRQIGCDAAEVLVEAAPH